MTRGNRYDDDDDEDGGGNLQQRLLDYREKLSAGTEENASLQQQLQEAQRSVTHMKADLSRKAKLLAASKSSQASEEAAAEQWKEEAKALEDTVRRLTRALSNKDNLFKDLRAKIEAQRLSADDLNK